MLFILKCGATIPINSKSSATASSVINTEKLADSFTPKILIMINTTLKNKAEYKTGIAGYKKWRYAPKAKAIAGVANKKSIK